jgi:hypothetical protein
MAGSLHETWARGLKRLFESDIALAVALAVVLLASLA